MLRVTLQNYRVHRDTTIDLSPNLTIITGANRSGKSSVRFAIEAALAATNEMTDDRGSTIRGQIRLGEKAARVVVETSNDTHTIDLPGKRVGSSWPVNVVRACLRPGWFLGLPTKEQVGILQAEVGLAPSLTLADWQRELNSWSPEFPDLGDWTRTTYRDDLGTGDGDTIGRETLYRLAYEHRAAVNAEMKAVVARLETMPEQPARVTAQGDPVTMQATIDGISERIAIVRAERDIVLQKHAMSVTLHQEQVRARESIDRRVAETQREVEEAIAASTDAQKRRGSGKRSPANVQARLEKAQGSLDAAVAAEKSAREALVHANSGDGACPAGVCVRAQIAELSRQLEVAANVLTAARDAYNTAQAEYAESERLGREADLLSRRAAEAGGRLRDLLREQVELGPIPDPPVFLEDAGRDSLLESLEKTRSQALQTLGEIRRSDAALAAYNDACTLRESYLHQQEHLQAIAARLACLVDSRTGALTENGIVCKRWLDELSRFAQEVADELRSAPVTVRFGVKAFGVCVGTNDAFVSAVEASTAERCWASAALQCVIARRTGFPVIAVDELGDLDGHARRSFYRWASVRGIQVLAIAPAQDVRAGELVRPAAVSQSAVRIYWMDNGTATELGSQQREEKSDVA